MRRRLERFPRMSGEQAAREIVPPGRRPLSWTVAARSAAEPFQSLRDLTSTWGARLKFVLLCQRETPCYRQAAQ